MFDNSGLRPSTKHPAAALRFILRVDGTPSDTRSEPVAADARPGEDGKHNAKLKLIAQGLTTKAIARQLDISVKTADTHRAQLMERLEIHDIAGLVRYAIRTGLVEEDA